jgi:hypothetical protein
MRGWRQMIARLFQLSGLLQPGKRELRDTGLEANA